MNTISGITSIWEIGYVPFLNWLNDMITLISDSNSNSFQLHLSTKSFEREKATTRCHAELDSGLTKADFVRPDTYLCVHFARGACTAGPECSYLHRIPTEEDCFRVDLLHDVFGRGESFNEHETE